MGYPYGSRRLADANQGHTMKDARKSAAHMPVDDTALPDLTTFLPHRLAILSRLTQLRLTTILERSGITVAQWRVFHCLTQRGPSTLNAISSFTQLPQSSLSRSVAKMHELGLVQNLRNPSDRRISQIEITAKGRKELAAAARAIDESWEKALKVEPGELHSFIGTVNKLIDHLSEAPPPATGPATT